MRQVLKSQWWLSTNSSIREFSSSTQKAFLQFHNSTNKSFFLLMHYTEFGHHNNPGIGEAGFIISELPMQRHPSSRHSEVKVRAHDLVSQVTFQSHLQLHSPLMLGSLFSEPAAWLDVVAKGSGNSKMNPDMISVLEDLTWSRK